MSLNAGWQTCFDCISILFNVLLQIISHLFNIIMNLFTWQNVIKCKYCKILDIHKVQVPIYHWERRMPCSILNFLIIVNIKCHFKCYRQNDLKPEGAMWCWVCKFILLLCKWWVNVFGLQHGTYKRSCSCQLEHISSNDKL